MLVRLLDLLWLRWWWRRHGTGNFRDCQGYWSACAPRLCRCRSWAHDPCLGSDWQRSQTFHSSERRHRGFEAGHVGEDSRTGGKRTKGTFNNDMASEMDMSVDEHVTNSLSPWANAVCPHWKSAVLYELCTARGVYTTRRTHGCCCWLSAKLRCSNFFFQKKKILEQDEACGQTLRLLVTTLSLSFWVGWHQLPICFYVLFENASSRLFHSPLFWPFIVLPTALVPFLPARSPWRWTPPWWARWPAGWGWLMIVFCEVFCPNCAQPLEVPLQWRINLVM